MSITVNGIEYLSYEETARVLNVAPATVAGLVHRKKLPATKFLRDTHKYIEQGAVKAWLQHEGTPTIAETTKNTVDSNPLNIAMFSQPLPETPIQDILRLVNEGFSRISSDHKEIGERYQETVSPIINHAISAPERAFIDGLSQVMQQMLNNAIIAIKTPELKDAAPANIVEALLDGIELPSFLKDNLITMASEYIPDKSELLAS